LGLLTVEIAGVGTVEIAGVGEGGGGAEFEALTEGASAARSSVDSEKSHSIACLTQLPQEGWTSSHWRPNQQLLCLSRKAYL